MNPAELPVETPSKLEHPDTSNNIARDLVRTYVARCVSGQNQYRRSVFMLQHFQANIFALRNALGDEWETLVAPLFSDTRFAILKTITLETDLEKLGAELDSIGTTETPTAK